MELRLLRIFQRHVATQCFAALASAQTADAALGESNHEVFWAEMQGCVTAATNVANALWGRDDESERERAPLRESLDVDGANPLRIARGRNPFEQFDEHVDRWRASPTANALVERVIGPRAGIADVDQRSICSHFDPETGELTVWATRYPLKSLVVELTRLYAVAGAAALEPD